MKRFASLLVLALFAASAAHAAEGKVVSVADGAAVVDMGAAAKFKSGEKIKLNGRTGTVTTVEGGKLTIKAPNAGALKAGEAVKVDKAVQLQGC